jgi:glycosyltransferase involved in cell wall biosynthesis
MGSTRRILIVHNVVPHERFPFDMQLTRLALRKASEIIVHSQQQLAELSELLPGVRARQLTMPPHVGEPRVTPPPDRPPLRLIQPGYVRPYKGVDIAIEGLRTYLDRHPDSLVHLTIVGDFWDPSADDAREMVESRGLSSSVQIEDGYLPDNVLLQQIAGHHAALLPYTSATQSGLIPAVLSVGRPVITTHVGGLAEQVRDGINAIVCRPNSPTEVADAIERLEKDYDRLQSAAAQGIGSSQWKDFVRELLPLI